MKILAVDDNQDILELLETILTPRGHEFTQVDNGVDGLKLIREQQFDIVFLDLFMPSFSGVDVVKALVNEGLIKKQKVVLFTASTATEKETEILLKNGVHSCLRKPITISTLVDHISKISVN